MNGIDLSEYSRFSDNKKENKIKKPKSDVNAYYISTSSPETLLSTAPTLNNFSITLDINFLKQSIEMNLSLKSFKFLLIPRLLQVYIDSSSSFKSNCAEIGRVIESAKKIHCVDSLPALQTNEEEKSELQHYLKEDMKKETEFISDIIKAIKINYDFSYMEILFGKDQTKDAFNLCQVCFFLKGFYNYIEVNEPKIEKTSIAQAQATQISFSAIKGSEKDKLIILYPTQISLETKSSITGISTSEEFTAELFVGPININLTLNSMPFIKSLYTSCYQFIFNSPDLLNILTNIIETIRLKYVQQKKLNYEKSRFKGSTKIENISLAIIDDTKGVNTKEIPVLKCVLNRIYASYSTL